MMKIPIANDSPANRAVVPSVTVGNVFRGIGSRSSETPARAVNSNRAWRRWFSRKLGVNTAIAIFNAILIGLLWNAVLGLVQTERQNAIRAAIDRNDNLAVAFEQYTVRTIESANAEIRQLIRAYMSSRGTMELEQFVTDFTIDNETIIGVVLADEHGNAKTSAYLGNSVKPINVRDREHFRVHIEHDSGKVFVGKPVLGRLTGKWVIPVTRRINKADGTFGGVAMALIEPGRFTDVLHEARLRSLDVISLVGLDGITRARLKGETASTGEDVSKSRLFAEQATHPVGNFFSEGQVDNVRRFFSYRTLPDYQVMAIVGTAEADVMGEFYRRQTQHFWAAGLTSAFIAGFAILLMLALASQRRAVTSIARSQGRFLATFNQAAVGIAHSDPDGRYLAVNQKLCAILGYSKEELLARTFSDVTHPDDIHSITDSRRQLLTEPGESGALALEKRCIRKDGAIIWCAMTMSVVRDGSGQVDYVLVVVRDISDRKQAETRIRHLNRVYAVLSGISALIVRVHDRQELLDAACRIAVEQGQFGLAWIGMFDPATQDVTPVAWAGEGAEEVTRARSSARAEDPRGKGAVGQAVRERRPVFNNDVSAHGFGGPRMQVILSLGFRSQITLPLYEDRAVVATLTMYAREPNFFDDEEIRLLTQLAGDISFALVNISRLQKLGKLARVRAVSSEINAAIIRMPDREALLRETCRIVVEHGKFELVWIALIDQEKQLIHPVAWAGFSSEVAHTLDWARLGTPGATLAEVIRTRKAAVRNDFDSELLAGSLRQEAMKQGHRSTVCLPFVIDDSVVAAAFLFATGKGFFDDGEVALLNEMAGNISFALEHIEKEEKIARLSRIRAITGSINALIVRVRDRHELFRESCRIAVEQGQLPFAWIGVLDPLTQDVVPVAWAGEGAEEITTTKSSALDDTPRGKGAVGRAIRERQPVFNNDIPAHSLGGPRREQILRLGFQSLIALPLLEDSTVIGTLTLYAKESNFFDEEERRLLTELAGDISFALANISRQRKLEKLARIRAVSSEVNAAIIRIHDREALLREICRIAAEHGKFELVWIALIDHEKQELRPVAWTGFSREAAHAVNWTTIGAAQGTLGRAILSRKPAVRNDTPTDLPVGGLRREALRKGCLSTVCLPLVVDDTVVALIALFAPGARFFDDEELALLNEVAADVSFALQSIKKQEKLEYLSYYDVLTGLPNRTLFVDRLSQQMRSRGSEQQMVAVIVIDVERFRNINESLGHRGGDELLRSIAQRLGHAFHGKDYLARIGSNGFGAIVRGMKDAAGVAHLVENEVSSCFSQPFAVSGRELRVSVKAGIALFPVDGGNAEILFRNAESALKRAKASGERYLFYRPEMNARVAETLLLENKLRQALDKEEFVLHYQPKVDLATGTISGLEALIRWNDPQTGLVPPMKFIPLLEETGMILEAGRWAMLKAVADYREWHAQGREPPRIAVNVSPIQLRQKDFVEVVRNVIGGAGAAPHGLDLEITESLIMEDIEGNIEKLRAVRDMGVNIAIDDFGTGYSSLRYLAKLPINALKIDRSFIITMTGSADSMTLVSTIISLAHALNLRVIAEGVDAEEQRKLLRLLKCDEMQGYLFSRPVPRDDVLALLQAHSTVPA